MRISSWMACLCLTAAVIASADPLGTSFTYQGQLTDQGVPANGQYDTRFALFTAASGGAAVDSIELDNQAVAGGLLNASLDFTDAPYNGQALWVEVSLRAAGSSSFTTLSPRQSISATPYALYALSGNPGPQGVPGVQGPPGVAGPPGPSLTLPFAQTISSAASAAFTAGNSGDGIEGDSSGAGNSGIYGHNTSSGKGVFGASDGGEGVGGSSSNGIGVDGFSANSDGVFGISLTGTGVHAQSSGSGLSGPALNVVAGANNGIAILANATTTDAVAVLANGNSAGTLLKGLGVAGATEFQVTATGEVFAHGAFHPNGVDYSDRLRAAAGLEPGDVVAIGADGLLHRSMSPNERDVAGVYSTKPGVVGQREEELGLTIPVALAGVIPVKATPQNGAIHVGDLLVSSSSAGRAMRAPRDPLPGTVVGKAMQALDGGDGEIQMLVMLR